MNPKWEDAPEWAQFLARDTKGGWWWYECEPLPFDGDFAGLGLTVGRVQQASCYYEPVWEERP